MRLLPPILFLMLIVASAAIGLLLPVVGPMPLPVRLVGPLAVLGGLGLTVRGAGLFSRVGTNINTFRDPDQLVTSGLFRYSRNPMYLGFLVALVGAALAVGSATAFVGPAVFWLVARFWYIPFEERRMADRFGADYLAYRQRVGRWIAVPGVGST